MSWVGAFGGAMTLGPSDVHEWTADPVDLDTIRHEHRSRAAKTRGGLVSAEIVELPGGAIVVPPSSGPKRILSDSVVRELYRIAKSPGGPQGIH